MSHPFKIFNEREKTNVKDAKKSLNTILVEK